MKSVHHRHRENGKMGLLDLWSFRFCTYVLSKQKLYSKGWISHQQTVNL